MKRKLYIPQRIKNISLINFFKKKNLKFILNEQREKNLGINEMKVKSPYKPDLKDLYSLYKLVTLNKRTTILEFGSGWSTLIFSVAMGEMQNKYRNQIKKLRRNNPFEIFTIENEKKFLNISKKRINQYFKNKTKNRIRFHYTNANMTLYNGCITTEYEKLPMCNPDFIYIDGPGQFNIKKSIYGLTTGHKDLVPLNCDILKIEFFLLPGTIVVVDGRGAEAQFLKKNFKRNWIYKRLDFYDQHLFYLDEPSLGKYNALQKKFYLGDI